MLRRLLLLLLGLPTAFSCQPERPSADAGDKRNGVRIVVQLASTQYHLQPNRGRFLPFTGHKPPVNTAMVAYRIIRHGPPFSAPPYRYDTVEVAVTPAQAARLVALTKTYVDQGTLPAGDSLRPRRPHGDTDAVSGRILLDVGGQQGPAQVGALDARSGDGQRAAFFRVEEGFAQLFDELPAQ